MLVALQSVIMLVIIAYTCDVETAGIYTIAYATANLFLYIGNYGMRQFQASDRNGQFSFGEYRRSRFMTCSAMVVIGYAYLAFTSLQNGYPPDKSIAMGIMMLFKAVDALEDVFHGQYQREGRLDVASKLLAFRMMSTLLILGVLVAATKNLSLSLAISTGFTTVFFLLEIPYVKKRHGMPREQVPDNKRELRLLATCFPLFFAAFLLFYIGNAPRYAIDALLDDGAQAVFGYIMMPNFVVTLLASFIYNPMIASLTDQWNKGNRKAFLFRFARLYGAIAVITILCALAAWIVGVPILDVLYNTDLARYSFELVMLIVGGGFLAVIALATLGIAILRIQKALVPIYVLVGVAAFLASRWSVSTSGLTGACWAYFFCMLALALSFTAVFVYGVLSNGLTARP